MKEVMNLAASISFRSGNLTSLLLFSRGNNLKEGIPPSSLQVH